MIGEHAVKHTSSLQGAAGSELTHSAAHGLGLKVYRKRV